MLGYLVQAHQRQDLYNSTLDGKVNDNHLTKSNRSAGERDYASLFRKQEEETKFKLSEKEVLPEVKEVDETVDSQATSSKIEDIIG